MRDTKSSMASIFPMAMKGFTSEISVASPGRINLIGEHTDYNEGFVLPTAIDKKIFFEFRRNNSDSICGIFSRTYDSSFEIDLENIVKSSSSWENYLLGVVTEIQKKEKEFSGFDCIITSELPIGAGISSSAALECGFATGINELFDLQLSPLEIVELSQRAENIFVGSNCGIMDQYASVMSRQGNLILLDCQSLQAEYIPADFQHYKLLLLNTNVSHNLAEGEYNNRRKECEETVRFIQHKNPKIGSLRDVNLELLENFKSEIPEVNYQRAYYVLKENERVLQASRAIKAGDLQEFGALMYQSHKGLEHEYEVSCPELDFLVDFSRDKDFIYGSRMMGGGFGGCTINLIAEEHIETYIEEVGKKYKTQFDTELDAIAVLPSEGTTVTRAQK